MQLGGKSYIIFLAVWDTQETDRSNKNVSDRNI